MTTRWRPFRRGLDRASARGRCEWCGNEKRTMFAYRAEGGRFLSGLSGEGKTFCNFKCFGSYQ